MSLGPNSVSNDLVFAIDAANHKSYNPISAPSDVLNMASPPLLGSLINGAGFDGDDRGGTWTFDGVNDYIDYGDTLKNVSGASTTFSIEAWVYKTTAGSGAVFSKTGNIPQFGWSLQFRGSGALLLAVSNNGTDIRSHYTNVSFPVNKWAHAVGVHDGVNDDVHLYINGILQGKTLNQSEYSAYGTIHNSTADVRVGIRDSPTPIPLAGRIGFVKMYHRVVDADEILQNYNALKWRYQL